MMNINRGNYKKVEGSDFSKIISGKDDGSDLLEIYKQDYHYDYGD